MYALYIENNIPYTKEMKCIIKNFLFNVLFEVRRIRRLRAPDVRHRYFHCLCRCNNCFYITCTVCFTILKSFYCKYYAEKHNRKIYTRRKVA